jgi:hypothetical protein
MRLSSSHDAAGEGSRRGEHLFVGSPLASVVGWPRGIQHGLPFSADRWTTSSTACWNLDFAPNQADGPENDT